MPKLLAALFLGWLISLAPAAVQAQAGATVAFGSMKGDPTLPVEITADQLRVNQASGTAIFTGNVIAIQGTMRLTAPEVQVNYAADGKKIARLHATGGVPPASAYATCSRLPAWPRPTC